MTAAPPTQQARDAARAEYEAKTKGLSFTKDFRTRQEALMRDPLATIGERVMAWILRRSWGEYSLYTIKDDGTPAYQVDCANELGIDKRKVSNAVAYNQRRGYLENQPKKLYPVIAPISGDPPQKVTRSPDFLQFIEDWKVTHSADFQELEVARSTVERIRKVILSEYKKSRRPNQNGGASLLEIKESVKRDPIPPPQPFVLGSNGAPPPESKAEEEEDDRDLYQEFKAEYPGVFDEAKVKPAFDKKTKTERVHVLERLQVYLRCPRWQDEAGKWIPWAAKWLESCDLDPPPLIEKKAQPAGESDATRKYREMLERVKKPCPTT